MGTVTCIYTSVYGSIYTSANTHKYKYININEYVHINSSIAKPSQSQAN